MSALDISGHDQLKESDRLKDPAVLARLDMRQRMSDLYVETPSLSACNQKLAAVEKQIGALGERTTTNASKLDQLVALKETINRLVALFETKRKQWQYYEAQHANIALELTTLLAEQPESVAGYSAYLQKIQDLTRRLTHIAERQRLFTGDEDVKGGRAKSHGLTSVIAPGVSVLSATKEFLGTEISKLDRAETELGFEPSSEDKLQSEYFAKLKGRTPKAVREFYDSAEYKDLRTAYAEIVKEPLQTYRKTYESGNSYYLFSPDEIEQFLQIQFNKMAQFATAKERDDHIQAFKEAVPMICRTSGCLLSGDQVLRTVRSNRRVELDALLMQLTLAVMNPRNDEYPQSENLANLVAVKCLLDGTASFSHDSLRLDRDWNLAQLSYIRNGTTFKNKVDKEAEKNILLAELLPILNRRQAKLKEKDPKAVLIKVPEGLPELRTDKINGNIELVHPPLPEANTLGAVAYRAELNAAELKNSAAASALAERQAKYPAEDAEINAVLADYEVGMRLCEEINAAYNQADKLARQILLADKNLGFANAELARLEGLYTPLRKKVSGVMLWGKAEATQKADELAVLMMKLHEKGSPDEAATDPYEVYAIQAVSNTKTKAEFDLAQLLLDIQVRISELEVLKRRVAEAKKLRFVDPVSVWASYTEGAVQNKAIVRTTPDMVKQGTSVVSNTEKFFRSLELELAKNEHTIAALEGKKREDILASVTTNYNFNIPNPFAAKQAGTE